MISKKYLIVLAIIFIGIAASNAKRDSVARAAETVAPIDASSKAITNDPKGGDQVKHQIMAFDLEGLADDGSKKWDVKGKSAESVTETQVKLNDVTANSYGKEAQATITADSGLYDRTKNNVRLEQNVKAVIENTQKSTNDFIGAEKNVAAGADKSKKMKTTITCDGEVEFNYEKNEGYFSKNVHVVNEEGTIDADKITIYLDSTTKSVKTIVAEGNVKIQRGENTTYSDKATYIEADKKIVLTGQPKLVIYQEGSSPGAILGISKK